MRRVSDPGTGDAQTERQRRRLCCGQVSACLTPLLGCSQENQPSVMKTAGFLLHMAPRLHIKFIVFLTTELRNNLHPLLHR